MTESKVLVVEDNESMRALLSATLKSQFNVLCAENGTSALKLCYEFNPHIIILDIMLPDMSGYEVCTHIKADKALCEIPIIMLSAKTGINARVTGYNLGAVNYLEKPFESSELHAIIKSVLSSRSIDESQSFNACDLSIDTTTQVIKLHEKTLNFTQSEYRLLLYMIKRVNQVLTRESLLQISAPDRLDITDRVVDNHISNLRKKLKESQIQINSVYGEGYKLVF